MASVASVASLTNEWNCTTGCAPGLTRSRLWYSNGVFASLRQVLRQNLLTRSLVSLYSRTSSMSRENNQFDSNDFKLDGKKVDIFSQLLPRWFFTERFPHLDVPNVSFHTYTRRYFTTYLYQLRSKVTFDAGDLLLDALATPLILLYVDDPANFSRLHLKNSVSINKRKRIRARAVHCLYNIELHEISSSR